MATERWATVRLGDAATILSGGTPNKQRSEYWGGNFPWISAKDLKTPVICTSELSLTREGKRLAKLAPEGSVLILVRGMTLLKDVPVGFASRDVAFNQDIKALIPRPGVSGRFLSYVLTAFKHRLLRLVNVAGHGTGRLDTDLLKDFTFELPSFGEQLRIVEMLGAWDETIESLQRLIAAKRDRKRGLMQVLLTGRKRFEEFKSYDWERRPFDDLFYSVSGKAYQVKRSEYALEGAHPVVDQGKELIAGFSDSPNVYSDVPIIVFGDHTRAIKWVDFPFVVGADGTQLLKTTPTLDIEFGHYLLHTARIPNLGYSRHFSELKENVFHFPTCLVEQRKIASVLSTAGAEIENLERQLAAYKMQQRGLMQQLLTGKKRVKVDGQEAVPA